MPSLLLYVLLLNLAAPHWVAVEDDGSVRRIEGLMPWERPTIEGVDHFWHGSALSAPRRVETAEVADFVPSIAETALRVHIPLPRRHPARAGRLTAAPTAMWERVPEDLLPSWPRPPDGVLHLPRTPGEPWRVRFHAEGHGTWWTSAPAGRVAVGLGPQPAEPLDFEIVGEGAGLLASSALQVSEATLGRGGRRFMAHFLSDDGRLELRGLPDLGPVSVLVTAPDHVPRWLEGLPSSLPRRIVLERGGALKGRLVDVDRLPIADGRLRLETLVGTGFLSQDRPSDAEGAFHFAGLAAGPAALHIAAEGFGTRRLELELDGEARDLGELVLEPAVSLEVTVRDPDGSPIAGAELTVQPGTGATTDAEGQAEVRNLSPEETVELTADARGWRADTRTLRPPLPDALELVLEPVFVVRGRFVDGEGRPFAVARVVAQVEQPRGTRTRRRSPDADGRFELELEPDRPVRLLLASPQSRELRLELEPGRPGEVRELGTLEAEHGHRVHGQLLSALDRRAVAGARIWIPRTTARHPAEAWSSGDLQTATSDVEGEFTVSGLDHQPGRLTIEAPGFARRLLPFEPEPGADVTELGTVELEPGTELEVVLDGATAESLEEAVARLDLGNRWLEMDMLTAPVVDGRARLPHVPPGVATLTVLRGRDLLCEKRLDIPPDVPLLEVVCRAVSLRVSGRVDLGGYPAEGGQLSWMPPPLDSPGFIEHTRSDLGQVQSRMYGSGRPQVDVTVDADGYFHTDRLRPGDWQVMWVSPTGRLSPTQSVRLAEPLAAREGVELVLDFPLGAVVGRVVDLEGRPAEGARVRVSSTGQVAFADADGRFELIGLEPGELWLQAEKDGTPSAAVAVRVESDRDPEPVELVLGEEDAQQELRARVSLDGQPAAGAFVFVETRPDGGLRILTADGEGRIILRPDPPPPPEVRFAAFTPGGWHLGPWLPWTAAVESVAAGEALELDIGAVGTLELRAEDPPRTWSLLSPDGWDLALLLRRLGRAPFLQPNEPAQVPGLPPGVYTLEVEGVARQVGIEAGRISNLDL